MQEIFASTTCGALPYLKSNSKSCCFEDGVTNLIGPGLTLRKSDIRELKQRHKNVLVFYPEYLLLPPMSKKKVLCLLFAGYENLPVRELVRLEHFD